MPTPAPKRRWLTFSLRTFLVVTLALSLILGYFGRRWWKAYRDSQPPTLRELAQIAKRHGIPMPPQGATLVLVRTGERSIRRGLSSRPVYAPAFLLSEQPNGTLIILCGDKETESPRDLRDHPEWPGSRGFSLDRAKESLEGYELDSSDAVTLLCAIQLADRDDKELAGALFQRWQEDGAIGGRAAASPLDWRQFVRELAYDRIQRRLWESESEQWPEIRDQMARLLDESEPLRREHGQLLADLTATVNAPPPPPDSVEAILLQVSLLDHDSKSRSREIVSRGFDSVPDLIRLSDDRRLAADLFSRMDSGNPGEFRRVGDVADELLVALSCYDRKQSLSVEMPDEISDLNSAFWNKWWEQARQQGEREYYVRNFFDVSQRDCTARQTAADILAAKHPDALLHLGEEYLQIGKFSMPRLQMVQAIRRLNLPAKTRAEMLSNLAQHGTPPERRDVLRELFQFDAKRAAELLVQLFDELPAETKGFGREEAMNTFPRMELILGDRQLSRAYLAAARRNVSLRMELISRLAYWYASDSEVPRRLALLSAFLDDETPRDRSLLSERFFSDDFAGITVRDFAAMHSAKLLGLEAQPNQDWTPDQWSALRDQVRERLAQEKLPELE